MRRQRLVFLGMLCGFLLLLPVFTSNAYILHIFIMGFIWSIFALGLNLLLGYTGQMSVAHAGLFGIGAYGSALLAIHAKFPFWLSLPIAIAVVVIVSIVIAIPAVRTRGMSFAVLTLSAGMILYEIFINWNTLTKGPLGIMGIPLPSPIRIGSISLSFDQKSSLYYLVFFFTIASVALMAGIVRTQLGKMFVCIREDEQLASVMGINVGVTKCASFVLSSLFAGLAGALYAHYIRYISPESFSFGVCFEAIVMAIVGGSGTLAGPIVGAFLLITLPEVLRAADSWRLIVYAALLLIVLIYMPEGIVPKISALYSRVFPEVGRKEDEV